MLSGRLRLVLPVVVFVVVAMRLILTTPFPAPDELEHVSTAAQLQETGELIPRYGTQTSLQVDDLTRWSDRRNYIGHPSPYYLLMARVLDRSLPPQRAVLVPRVVSLALLVMGLGVALGAGLRWFGGDGWVFGVFAAGLVLCPELLSIARQVNNDALGLLGGGVAYWGVGRWCGRRWVRDGGAALGLALALWAKPNAGLEVGVFLMVVAVLDRVRRVRLLGAVGVGGVVGVLPYVPIVLMYHAIVPVAVETLWPMHDIDGFGAYLPVFAGNLGATWGFIKTGSWPMAPLAVVTSLIFWTTLGGIGWGVGCRGVADPARAVAVAALVAFAVVVPIHLYFASARLGYSIPAASFRYYLPLWPGLAHAGAYAWGAASGRVRGALGAAYAITMGLGWLP